jgi:hypothetical protein
LGARYGELFSVLQRAGFECIVDRYDPKVFGNFVVTCSSRDALLRVTNDRGQIFVAVAARSGPWRDKEEILEELRIPRSRHQTVAGLWAGYGPEVQADDLREFLPLLVKPVPSPD